MTTENKLRAMLQKYDFDENPIIRILYTEKNMQKMIDILETHTEVTDVTEIYVISAKIADIPCKPVDAKIKAYMDKWGVRKRTKPWYKEDDE